MSPLWFPEEDPATGQLTSGAGCPRVGAVAYSILVKDATGPRFHLMLACCPARGFLCLVGEGQAQSDSLGRSKGLMHGPEAGPLSSERWLLRPDHRAAAFHSLAGAAGRASLLWPPWLCHKLGGRKQKLTLLTVLEARCLNSGSLSQGEVLAGFLLEAAGEGPRVPCPASGGHAPRTAPRITWSSRYSSRVPLCPSRKDTRIASRTP